jgi:hypothetical protein
MEVALAEAVGQQLSVEQQRARSAWLRSKSAR